VRGPLIPRLRGYGGRKLELTIVSLLLVAIVLRLGNILWTGRGGGTLVLTILGLILVARVLRLLRLLRWI
jgi:hypothetical protein